MVFTLGGLPADFDPTTDITNVWFQYGTSLCEPSYEGHKVCNPPPISPAVPEPITAAGFLMGVAGIARYIRRRSRG